VINSNQKPVIYNCGENCGEKAMKAPKSLYLLDILAETKKTTVHSIAKMARVVRVMSCGFALGSVKGTKLKAGNISGNKMHRSNRKTNVFKSFRICFN
jgi:hypothetical protein